MAKTYDPCGERSPKDNWSHGIARRTPSIFLSEHEGFGYFRSWKAWRSACPRSPMPQPPSKRRSGEPVQAHCGLKDFGGMAAAVRSVLSDATRKGAIIQSQKQRASGFAAPAQREALRELLDYVARLNAPKQYNPRISVVINTYNRARQLDRCLEILRKQIYRNFEIVVVNGPSTDDTSSVLRRFAGQIRVVETSSRVLSVSRNLGIQASAGELVAFIDDDAVAAPNWLAGLARPFNDPTVGAAGGLVYRWTGNDVEFRNGIIDTEGFVRWDEPVPGSHLARGPKDISIRFPSSSAFSGAARSRASGFWTNASFIITMKPTS